MSSALIISKNQFQLTMGLAGENTGKGGKQLPVVGMHCIGSKIVTYRTMRQVRERK